MMRESEKLLLEIAAMSKQMHDFQIIVDVRHSSSELGAGDLWHLAAKLAEHPATFTRKTAILCPVERLDNAAFLALCAQNRGLRLRAFASYEDAMEWLLASTSARTPPA